MRALWLKEDPFSTLSLLKIGGSVRSSEGRFGDNAFIADEAFLAKRVLDFLSLHEPGFQQLRIRFLFDQVKHFTVRHHNLSRQPSPGSKDQNRYFFVLAKHLRKQFCEMRFGVGVHILFAIKLNSERI